MAGGVEALHLRGAQRVAVAVCQLHVDAWDAVGVGSGADNCGAVF